MPDQCISVGEIGATVCTAPFTQRLGSSSDETSNIRPFSLFVNMFSRSCQYYIYPIKYHSYSYGIAYHYILFIPSNAIAPLCTCRYPIDLYHELVSRSLPLSHWCGFMCS